MYGLIRPVFQLLGGLIKGWTQCGLALAAHLVSKGFCEFTLTLALSRGERDLVA